jgi:hypothetical protein
MDVESVHALHQRFPDVQLVLSHLGDDVEVAALPYAIVPDDLQTLNF